MDKHTHTQTYTLTPICTMHIAHTHVIKSYTLTCICTHKLTCTCTSHAHSHAHRACTHTNLHGINCDGFPIHDQFPILCSDLTFKLSVGRIVLKEVGLGEEGEEGGGRRERRERREGEEGGRGGEYKAIAQ